MYLLLFILYAGIKKLEKLYGKKDEDHESWDKQAF